jgi:hypothetical protein
MGFNHRCGNRLKCRVPKAQKLAIAPVTAADATGAAKDLPRLIVSG